MKTIKLKLKRIKKAMSKSLKNPSNLVLLAMLLISITDVFAGGAGGAGGFGSISTKLTSWTSNIRVGLNLAVGAFAIVGGFIVFIQYMQGNDSAQKNFIKFVIGLAIFGLSAALAGVFITP